MPVIWVKAPDVKKRVLKIVKKLNISSITSSNIYCFRSSNSKTKAFARIWGLSKIWQIALKREACYIIEVISERYDNLKLDEKDKILLHELNHIPKNFSGSLLPHYRKGKNNFNKKLKLLLNSYYK